MMVLYNFIIYICFRKLIGPNVIIIIMYSLCTKIEDDIRIIKDVYKYDIYIYIYDYYRNNILGESPRLPTPS